MVGAMEVWQAVNTNPIAAAVLIIFYFQYQLRWGRLASYMRLIESLTAIVIALAQAVDEVDDEAVRESLTNGDDSANYEELIRHGAD